MNSSFAYWDCARGEVGAFRADDSIIEGRLSHTVAEKRRKKPSISTTTTPTSPKTRALTFLRSQATSGTNRNAAAT